MNLTIISENF